MSWQRLYLNYDEDALSVFANVGLLRRAKKDLVGDKVMLVTDAGQEGHFASDGQQVVLGAQGIQTARCDCPATGCCKHILAAVLWLQTHAERGTEQAAVLSAETVAPPIDVLAEILQLDPDVLMKQVGKVQTRQAARFVQMWAEESVRTESLPNQLKIYLPTLESPVIYLAGTGMTGMLSDFLREKQPALHLATIARLFAENQRVWPWPEDCFAQESSERALNADEQALITMLNAFIHDVMNQGLSHISKSSARQLHLLNMSARAEGLPRLAGYLRTLSGQVSLLADRHYSLEERDVLLFIARLSAYLFQLEQASPERLLLLRGQVRRQYQQQPEALSLVPLGAQWWVTEGGARGATFSFWESENQQLLHCTQARADRHDVTFSRQGVWQGQAMWKQLGEHIMRAPFTLHHPRFSDDGKLAAGGESYANLDGTPWPAAAYAQCKSTAGIADWSQLSRYFEQENQDYPQPLLLHVHRYEPVIWHEVEQRIIWPVFDDANNALHLSLNWKKAQHQRIDRLKQATQQKWEIVAVLVQPRRRGNDIDLQPYSLLVRESGIVKAFCLDFQTIKSEKKALGFISYIQTMLAEKKQKKTVLRPPMTLAQRICQPILDVLDTQACTGRRHLTATQREQLQHAMKTANELGLTLVERALSHYLAQPQPQVDSLLRVVFLCDRLQRFQNGLPIVLRQPSSA
ncbi:SWIM zinc finger family protein [Pectobacterium parmentieri]|uniref:SWIM zinc finger family protein n=1 Tax=Pectobacterium parmentieri TaxID=1905730 RepID=UPI0004740E7F|nr:SWIM zinc finger family protein [Pectobacterium parmentieri]PWD60764.1 SWIM zinc finger family protein [Pectobacterium parmentieri]